MKQRIVGALSCMGCRLGCRIGGDEDFNVEFCTDKKLVLWPEGNDYLKLALHELIFKGNGCELSEDTLIIDCSLRNLGLFINDEWLTFLSAQGMGMVLIPDRRMIAIAHYWWRKSTSIKGVISTDAGMGNFMRDLKKRLCGGSDRQSKTPVATEREMHVLAMIYAGRTVQEIATLLGCSVKSVYIHKSAIKKKMGNDIAFHMLAHKY
ncbi:helix-turn-helix transcriptional regulator [Pantoea sp. At-9b]|uniref:helix-turn-helix domain-containing protein n=1 Tax=Pantoea sp. (strain At-9b) TaxID=592316 RepID=UPI0001B3E4B9|nr:helix-turn-helix transcriptional regulator [Pantoea sp. At-9b]ADU69030.1 transcriptional regulator, LuxR family [Pantoea sp. At-9b]